ncbi:MAG: hypothetical protein FWF43_01895 [Propionibacteriaceae bacterium]|nr:hypothetical protein [Propionibacteriaceae bacterium]
MKRTSRFARLPRQLAVGVAETMVVMMGGLGVVVFACPAHANAETPTPDPGTQD